VKLVTSVNCSRPSDEYVIVSKVGYFDVDMKGYVADNDDVLGQGKQSEHCHTNISIHKTHTNKLALCTTTDSVYNYIGKCAFCTSKFTMAVMPVEEVDCSRTSDKVHSKYLQSPLQLVKLLQASN
jgi:hypothetical protein